MENKRFREGLSYLDKVISKLNELKSVKKIDIFSVVYFNCSDTSFLEILMSHPQVKDIMNVSENKLERENITNISPEKWNKNREEYYQKTKNSFVIEEQGELVLGETYSVLEDFSNYYPIILFFTAQKINKMTIQDMNFSSQVLDGKFLCCINKKITMDFFSSYTIQDFEDVKKKSVTIKNIFRKEGEGKRVKINLSPKRESTKQTNSEPNFSFLDGIKSPQNGKQLDKYGIPKSKAWRQEFYEYLRDLLIRLFPPERVSIIDVILTNDKINKYWIPCFTHDIINPNRGKNYQAYETVGDVLQKYCFKLFVFNREPLISEERLTNLDQRYMSKDFQSALSKRMKLQEWMIGSEKTEIRMDISEDLLEAFYGTIDRLLFEIKDTPGLGTIVCYNLMKLLFPEDFVFPGTERDILSESDSGKKETIMPDKTFVQQAFKGPGFRMDTKNQKPYTPLQRPQVIPENVWKNIVRDMNRTLEENDINPVIIRKDTKDHPGIIEEIKKLPDGKTRVTIKVLESYVKILKKFGIHLDGKGDVTIGDSIKNTKESADKVAYHKAAEYMKSHGITLDLTKSVNEMKKSAVLRDEDKVLQKAKRKFPEIVSTQVFRGQPKVVGDVRGVILYQIRGITNTGEIIPLYSQSSTDPAYEQQIIDDFLDDKKF